jgi:hypothetical protein
VVPDVESGLDDSPLPEVSAIASWIDNFKMSIREIENRHTTSELVILSWYSRLQSFNMNKKSPRQDLQLTDGKTVTNYGSNPNGIVETETSYIMPRGINNGVAVPKKFFDADGSFNLRLATGPEAATYIRRLGISITVPHGM